MRTCCALPLLLLLLLRQMLTLLLRVLVLVLLQQQRSRWCLEAWRSHHRNGGGRSAHRRGICLESSGQGCKAAAQR